MARRTVFTRLLALRNAANAIVAMVQDMQACNAAAQAGAYTACDEVLQALHARVAAVRRTAQKQIENAIHAAEVCAAQLRTAVRAGAGTNPLSGEHETACGACMVYIAGLNAPAYARVMQCDSNDVVRLRISNEYKQGLYVRGHAEHENRFAMSAMYEPRKLHGVMLPRRKATCIVANDIHVVLRCDELGKEFAGVRVELLSVLGGTGSAPGSFLCTYTVPANVRGEVCVRLFVHGALTKTWAVDGVPRCERLVQAFDLPDTTLVDSFAVAHDHSWMATARRVVHNGFLHYGIVDRITLPLSPTGLPTRLESRLLKVRRADFAHIREEDNCMEIGGKFLVERFDVDIYRHPFGDETLYTNFHLPECRFKICRRDGHVTVQTCGKIRRSSCPVDVCATDAQRFFVQGNKVYFLSGVSPHVRVFD